MRLSGLIAMATVILLTSCDNARTPNHANFTAAINQYLARHGQACTLIGREFPVDVPRSTLSDSSGIGAKLAALEQTRLVSETDTTAAVHGMLDALRGPTPPQPVRRYQLTAEGQKYYWKVPRTVPPASGFCYGQKTVDAIIQWTAPQTGGSQSAAEVTYTYRIKDLAAWAQRTNIQQAFPEIQAIISGASKVHEIIGLQLADKGWEVTGP